MPAPIEYCSKGMQKQLKKLFAKKVTRPTEGELYEATKSKKQ